MAVFRPRRRVSATTIGIAVLVLAVLVILLFFATRRAVAPADPLAGAQAKAMEAANALDVFIVEYPKSTSSGAGPAFARAKSAFESAKAYLAQIDSAATDQVGADLTALNAKIAANAPAKETTGLAEKAKALLLT